MLWVREDQNNRPGVVDMSFIQVIRCDLFEDDVKLYSTSLFNYAVSMSKSNIEWCSNNTSGEKVVSHLELVYCNFLELIEENYKILHSEWLLCFLAEISKTGLPKMKQ